MSKYVALSYCWGGDQTNKLAQENHGLYKKNIAWETLPKTIQDAAKTAQALGFQYIWIDSMCIVQDSKEDKDAEISQMAKVYAHATLTIVNQRGDRVTEGFLHPRTLPSGTSSIQYRTKNGQTQCLTLSFDDASDREESLANTSFLVADSLLALGRQSGFVDERSMVTEMAGSPAPAWIFPFDHRSAEWAGKGPFGSKEAESVYSSSFVDAAMFFSVNPGYPSGQLNEELVRNSWHEIVESYSLRSVTESEDRILAISGIAERFADFVPGRYISGIWENMMPLSLLWDKLGQPTDRPAKYRGPSWSWTSIDGLVSHNASYNCMCEVLSIDHMPKSAEALYGAVRSAALHIKGPALSVEWRYGRQNRQRQKDKQPQEDLSELRWFQDSSDDRQDPQLTVNLDAREQTTEWREVVLLACGFSNYGSDYRNTMFIALTKVDQVEVENEPRHRFRRLGTGSFGDTSPLPRVESWPVSSYYVI
ncbi:unnamed protein product [Alternaria alternata]